ncbi:MAG: metallophosphoesterase [Elusimicrobiota bacterium]|nr:metallophosphoesterase [Elusimicrobiota bacterium]
MKAALTAVALWAAAVPSWGSVRLLRPGLVAPAGRPVVFALPLSLVPADAPRPSLRAPVPALAPLGVPGPGVTPAHAAAVQDLADRTGLTLSVHGSRQTGTRARDGRPFTPESDLNLAVVGPEAAAAAAALRFDGVPDARRAPAAVPTVEEAVGRGHLVFRPRGAPADHDAVARLAAPLRTERQLARLQERPRAPGESFRFTVIGDAEPGRFWFSRLLFGRPGVFRRLLERADASGSDFILQLGDLVSRGLRARFRDLFVQLRAARLSTPFLTVIGNHDRHAPHGVSNDRLYRRYWGATDWVLDRGDWRFVTVDSSAGRVTPEQLAWLDSVLVPGKRFVVFTHVPPAPLGEFTDYGRLKGVGGFREGSAAFMRLMAERGVERVYMGHVHGLGAVERDGVTYVLTGGGGSPLYPSPLRRLHHALDVEIGPEGVHETVRPLDGAAFRLR